MDAWVKSIQVDGIIGTDPMPNPKGKCIVDSTKQVG